MISTKWPAFLAGFKSRLQGIKYRLPINENTMTNNTVSGHFPEESMTLTNFNNNNY